MRPVISALALLVIGCSGAPPPTAEPTETAEGSLAEPVAERADEPTPAVCRSWPDQPPYERGIDGSHRRCQADADCVSVQLDCSALRCSAVHRQHVEAYSAPLACTGYPGDVGNYDCRSEFGAERAVCVAGCCSSERVAGHASGEDACNAIGAVYSRDACTVFGPTFSVQNCLDDVTGIRASADEPGLRRLQIGLDCARAVSSCAQIERCVSEFHSE